MRSNNRLTVLGSRRQVKLFQKSNWERGLRGLEFALLENSPERFVCQFVTKHAPLKWLTGLARHWPGLTLLLDYEIEANRVKGLAKAKGNKLEFFELRY